MNEDREKLLLALLPDVPFDGWTRHSAIAAGGRLGMSVGDVAAVFPRGPADTIAEFSRWADRQMLARLQHRDLSGLGTADRVASAAMERYEALALHREAVRRSLAVVASPLHAPLAARLLYETVDAIWYAVGDSAVDFSFYTKRTLLGGIYAATTLYWLSDRSANFTETRDFLERRLREVGTLPRWRQRIAGGFDALPHPFRLARALRGR